VTMSPERFASRRKPALPKLSVSIQSVLFNNPVEYVERAVRATVNSAVHARKIVGSWEIALGDCSPSRLLNGDTAANIAAEVAAAGGTFRYEFFGENLGHGGGHNRLAPGSSTDLLFILNPDALVGADVLRELVLALESGVGAADGRQLPLDHPKYYNPTTGDASWASGACLMTTREAFERVGGFDHETFFLYGDDVDYSWRVRLEGWRVIHVPAARVFHDKQLDVNGVLPPSEAERYYSAESALMLAHKYSRPRIVQSISVAFNGGLAGEAGRKALKEYRRRKALGSLSKPLDPDHRVGQFIDGNYARHRQ
jgi:GT2 family glycosyltransferase